MTRNVMNLEMLDQFLENISQDCIREPLRQWVRRSARKWLIKNFEPCGTVEQVLISNMGTRTLVQILWPNGKRSRVQAKIPDWYTEGMVTQWLGLGGAARLALVQDLKVIIRMFSRATPPIPVERLARVSFPDALKMAREMEAKLAAAARVANAVMAFETGYRVTVLESWDEFRKEGKAMNHCVASYFQSRVSGQEILSLRSPNDVPCVTMEVLDGKRIVQIKGRGNNPVQERYRPYIRDFTRAMGLTVVGDADHVGFNGWRFDPECADSWWHQPGLAWAVRRDGADFSVGDLEWYGRFLWEMRAALPAFDDRQIALLRALFAGADGNALWLEKGLTWDVYGIPVTVYRTGYPYRVLWALEDQKGSRFRDLRRQILNDMAQGMFQILTRETPFLVDLLAVPFWTGLDVSRYRHRRQTMFRERLAQARRRYRGRNRPRVADETLEQWETNRRHLLTLMEEKKERIM